MFFLSEQIKKEAQHIIEDDIDNDILLVVAHKGVGKTKLLNDIYGSAAYNSNLIVATGKSVIVNKCSLRRCFAEGILEYVRRNNKPLVRLKLHKIINISNKFFIRPPYLGRIPRKEYAEALCEQTINDLKRIYFDLAHGLPLIIVSSAMILTAEEIEYLKTLDDDPYGKLGARITFVLGIRAIPDSIENIRIIVNARQKGVWIMPLMPAIEKKADKKDVRSMASFSINGIGATSTSADDEIDQLANLLNDDTCRIVRKYIDNNINPKKLHILANQEISKQNDDYLQKITSEIYHKGPSHYEEKILLPYDNKLLWLDVLSYYYALKKNLDVVIQETQKFYFLLINRIVDAPQDTKFGKARRNSFIRFIHEAAEAGDNNIAGGFSQYYADLAKLTNILFAQATYQNGLSQEELIIGVLERVSIDFNIDSIEALQTIYDSTQICSVLDIGLETLSTYIEKVPIGTEIPSEIIISVREYLLKCVQEIYKWNDLTLVDKLLSFFSIASKHNDFRLNYLDIINPKFESSMKLILKQKITELVEKGALTMDAVNQNLAEFWVSRGESVVNKYMNRLNLPLGHTLSDSELNNRLTECEFLVLTANPIEGSTITRAFMTACQVEKPLRITADSQLYQFFSFMGHNIAHIMPLRTSSFSEHGSADAVKHALSHINSTDNAKLRAIFSLGIAYGKAPKCSGTDGTQNIGDVLISRRIVRWDAFIKMTDGKLTLNDQDALYISDEVLGGSLYYLQNSNYPIQVKEANIGQFRWFLGTFLSGNAVVSDPVFKRCLMEAAKQYRDIIGGEMEGSGIWYAARETNIPIMIIKGISDWGESKNGWGAVSNDETKGELIKDCVQAFACDNAFNTFAFLINQVYGDLT